MSKNLKVYFGDDEKPPYHIHSRANVLSAFNAAVRGQLLKTESGFKLKPSLIEEFNFDFKNNTYFLKLKDGLKFHNGRAVTSVDLEFAIIRGFYSPDRSFFHTYLSNIKGVEKIKKGSKFASGVVEGIKIIDDLSLTVELAQPNPSFLHSLTTPYFSLAPIEELEMDYLTWKKAPVGVGPYKVLVPWDGEKTVIQLIDSSLKTAPKEIWFLSRIKNESPDISIDESSISEKDKSKLVSDLPAYIRMFEFSSLNPLSQNEDFRKAINHVLDRSTFNSLDLGITKVNQLLPHHFWGQTDVEMYNLLKAKEFIQKVPKDLLSKGYEIPVFSGPKLSAKHLFYKDKIEKAFESIGFHARLVPNDEKFISKKTATEAPMTFFGMVCDYIDPLIMFSAYRENGHSQYYLPQKIHLSVYERMYKEASLATKFDDRVQTVQKISNYATLNSLFVPIAEEKTVYYYNSKTIKSFGEQFHPVTLFLEHITMREN